MGKNVLFLFVVTYLYQIFFWVMWSRTFPLNTLYSSWSFFSVKLKKIDQIMTLVVDNSYRLKKVVQLCLRVDCPHIYICIYIYI